MRGVPFFDDRIQLLPTKWHRRLLTVGSSRPLGTSAWLEVDALMMMDFEICVDEGHGHFSRPKQKNGTEIMHIFTQERLQVACVRMGQTQNRPADRETLGSCHGELRKEN
jgi:hypothetical protein